ncbi:MAG: magnesium-translocating P-type ATPase [Bacteroidales bacterium]|nr:magnesium-translocating P-type ATPase [Bacteroidales bacterium]
MKEKKSKKKKNEIQYHSEMALNVAAQPKAAVCEFFGTARTGLSDAEVESRQKQYGSNEITHEVHNKGLKLFIKAFINPFIGILMALVIVSFVIDVVMAAPHERDWTTIIIISTMVFASAILRFIQERKSVIAADALKKMVHNTATVYRNGETESRQVNILDIVPGDVVYLAAGDMLPADVRIIESKDLFISQSSLTGESDAVEKTTELTDENKNTKNVVECNNLCFMGSSVVSGSAIGVVFATGHQTYLGTIAKSLTGVRAQTSFDRGINNVSLLLIRFMLVMVPFVFLVNGITKGDWFGAFLFAISVAVGLTPEMLPMIVTSNLAKGAVAMARRKTIVKNLNAIQSFGAMNILCTDKTGTLTEDQIVLERYLNVTGKDDERVLRHAYFNSFFQTGLKNLMDLAILSHTKKLGYEHIEDHHKKIDEIPFDFTRRRMSVVIKNNDSGKVQIITKGAIEEMLAICDRAEYEGEIRPLTQEMREFILGESRDMNKDGMRVLGIAQKNLTDENHAFSIADESEMIFIGFLAFLDPPKESSAHAIRELLANGIEVKVLSGDNLDVVKSTCMHVGVDTTYTLTGNEIADLSDEELSKRIGDVKIFAKLTPMQKTRVITLLQHQGNTVGFLGDGINDASALRQADVGISVDTAVDIAKESADIILLEKDLMVLNDGVIEGRKIFGNIMKYIKMTASSNFGNMFSVMAASAFLPFLPMKPIHILINNMFYDISQAATPFDRVDKEYLEKPRKWDSSDLKRFMVFIGPISSIFDITTYLLMFFVICPQFVSGGLLFHHIEAGTIIQSGVFAGWNMKLAYIALFQTGWFVESLLSQTLIVHMIRTRKIPFIQSRASNPVMLLTFAIMALGIAFSYSTLGAKVGLVPLPWAFFPWLIATLLCYCVLTQFIKQWYLRKFERWL